jgi:omega-3 fatty acid desaturase (delta-15 desaturase)
MLLCCGCCCLTPRREPQPSPGPLPLHLWEPLKRSFEQDHYVDDTGDIVFYKSDPSLTPGSSSSSAAAAAN